MYDKEVEKIARQINKHVKQALDLIPDAHTANQPIMYTLLAFNMIKFAHGLGQFADHRLGKLLKEVRELGQEYEDILKLHEGR